MNRREYAKRYYQKNKERIKKKTKKYKQENKSAVNRRNVNYKRRMLKEAIAGYGSECLFCGEDRLEGLTFHHVNEGGGKHRKEVGEGGLMFLRWLINNNFPDGIVLLCGTCHLILHRTTNKKENDYE